MNSQIFKIRASAGGKLMTEPQGKTNLDKYNDALNNLKDLKNKYKNLKNKECKSGLEIINKKIPNTKKIIQELQKIKDIIELSGTTKSYLKEWAISQMFGVKNEIKSKYTERGIQDEDKAIDLMMQVLDLPFTIKNEQFFEDDFFTGTPDLILNGSVYDIKCSWDCFTFPLFDKEIPTKDYYYQLQVYMYLTGCKKAVLTYVLLNTPEELT